MSIETTKGGKLALSVQVRTGDDGWTVAALEVPGTGWNVLCSVPAPAYERSADVQGAFIALAQAVVGQMVADALPGVSIEGVHVVVPGAPLGGPEH